MVKPTKKSAELHEADLKERVEAHPLSVPFLFLGRQTVSDNFIYIPIAGLIITVALGFVFPMAEGHKAPWDSIPVIGYFAWALIGFIAYSFVVISAGPLFKLLARPEGYYEGETLPDPDVSVEGGHHHD